MMLPLLALLQAGAPATGGSPLGPIGRQALPASGCAAYLWTAGERHELVAMATPARLRVAVDGRALDLPIVEGGPAGSFGLPATAHYRAGDTDVALDITVAGDASLTQGGTVPGGTITLTRAGQDGVIVPVGGLVGCAT